MAVMEKIVCCGQNGLDTIGNHNVCIDYNGCNHHNCCNIYQFSIIANNISYGCIGHNGQIGCIGSSGCDAFNGFKLL